MLAAALPGFVAGEGTEYTLTFDKNGEDVTGNAPAPAQYKGGDIVAFPGRGDLVNGEKAFRGWATSKTAAKPLESYSMPSHDTTLYAVWGDSLVVTFKPNGGTMAKTAFDGYSADDDVANAEATKANSTLAGWYKDPALGEAWDFAVDKMPDRDLFLYAKWEPAAIATSVTGERDYCSVKDGGLDETEFTLKSSGHVYYTATLTGPGGKDYSTSNLTPAKSSFSSSATIKVRDLNDAGDYKLTVKFYEDYDRTKLISERGAPLKAVEPVVLKVTVTNGSWVAVELPVYFKVGGERVEGSEQTVKIPAATDDGPGKKEVEYKYVARDLGRSSTYSLEAENTETVAGTVKGLGVAHTFYSVQKDYSWATWLSAIFLVVVALIALYVYRKPVKNVGKPKSRR